MPSPEQPSPAPVLGIAHGYGFEDSGSNIWTREIVRALARQGYTVHVVCQVARPEAYAFVSRAVAYDAHPPRVLLDRETVFPGTVTVHRPDLRVIPAFVRPRQPEGHVAYIPDLSGPDTEEYIERNARVLEHVACAHGVGVWSVNHVLLMALAAHRAQSRGGAPYTVLPHGSAIEYVVKQSARALEQASEGLRGAARIFSLSPEMDDRLHDVFGIDANRDPRLIRIPLGTDTSVFQPLARSERRATVEHLALQIEGEPQGRTGGATDALYARLAALPPLPSDAAVLTALETEPELAEVSGPDANLAARLRAVDWPAKTVLFVGRLIAA